MHDLSPDERRRHRDLNKSSSCGGEGNSSSSYLSTSSSSPSSLSSSSTSTSTPTTTTGITTTTNARTKNVVLLVREEEVEEEASDGSKMDYAWMEPRHDPIITDTNLAEIDFEDFRNEDLAYAFSCGEEESGGSSTDMSICRSEVLFSSTSQPNYLQTLVEAQTDSCLIQDSLTDADFDYSEQLKVNKNHYTLTYSGHQTGIGAGSMVISTGGATGGGGGGLATILGGNEEIGTIIGRTGTVESPGSGKLTTWSNLGQRQMKGSGETTTSGGGGGGGGGNPKYILNEENNNGGGTEGEESGGGGGNNGSSSGGGGGKSRSSRSLPDMGFTNSSQQDSSKLIDCFMRNRSSGPSSSSEDNQQQQQQQQQQQNNLSWELQESLSDADSPGAIPMMRSKDTVNHFLKTAKQQQQQQQQQQLHLTSIEENTEQDYTTTTTSSSTSQATTEGGTTTGATPGPATTGKGKSGKPKKSGGGLPDLSFLENDVGLWDSFFLHKKNSAKFPSVLKFDEYLQNREISAIYDEASLRLLLPPSAQNFIVEESSNKPIQQVCQSLSRLNVNNTTRCSSSSKSKKSEEEEIKAVKVKEAWAAVPETATATTSGYSSDWIKHVINTSEEPSSAPASEIKRRLKKSKQNLNLINNNNTDQDVSRKRRSYHPPDYLSGVLLEQQQKNSLSPTTTTVKARISKRKNVPQGFPKSGSQNDLCDSWAYDEEDESTGSGGGGGGGGGGCGGASGSSTVTTPSIGTKKQQQQQQQQRGRKSFRNVSAEYPFQVNMCMPPQGINFDLTQKRGLFVSLYNAVERLLLYQDSSESSTRCILMHELCPALLSIMEDGLKPEVITSFGRMTTSVWRVVEAVTRQGPSSATATCDLVMLLNTRYAAAGEDHKKFAGFIMGLLNMSILHIWFSKLKWSMDVLLRFYERHSFICALHKETKLLFDELIFCLQRLYAIPFRFEIPSTRTGSPSSSSSTSATTPKCCCGCTSSSCCRSSNNNRPPSASSSSATTPTTTTTATTANSSVSGATTTMSSKSKSRIPRPISLPKRLEAKLSKKDASPIRGSPTTPTSNNNNNNNVRNNRRKSRVRDTIRLFDSKASTRASGRHPQLSTPIVPSSSSSARRMRKPPPPPPPPQPPSSSGVRSPKTGAGESMAFDSSGNGSGTGPG